MSRISFRIDFLLFIGLFASRTLAQTTQTLRGRVLEQGTQQPIVGGAIALNGSTLGTLTDAEEYFRLPLVPLGRQTVVVSALGYEPQTLANLDISLSSPTGSSDRPTGGICWPTGPEPVR